LGFDLTGYTILEISIFENWIRLDATAFFLFAFHVDLELRFASGYPITLYSVGLLGIPTTAAGFLTDRGAVSKGIGC
jgi:hypothetical protein